MVEERLERETVQQPLPCYILRHVTSKFITLTHCPQLLWKTIMNQINIGEALGCGSMSVQPMDSPPANGFSRRREEGNKQGATAYAIYLAVIDD